MTGSRIFLHGGVARVGSTVLLLVAGVSPVPEPVSITARAAPTVSAAPAAVVAPPVTPAPDPGAGAAARGEVAAERWSWPVGPRHDVLRPFEAPASTYGAGHRGIDLPGEAGSPVRAPAAGVVSFSGVVVDRPVLSIQHAGDLVSSLEPVSGTVHVGDRVSAGQVLGTVATGAHCADRCVHFGVRLHGRYISPLLFLGGIERAVLLPLRAAGPAADMPRGQGQARGWASR
jgi:murein DD-endopeptidase MepM/ murein hydrolase activator NlpD